jgi:UDP-N-acetylglucosamine 2-epimerase (non-hydrolysing)
MCVVSARPNYMKIKPVMAALSTRGCDSVLVHTGQHYDHALSGVFLDELGMPAPDHLLGAGSGTHAEQTARIMTAFEPLVAALRPDAVVVAGDVNGTLACALVAAKGGALVAHVEAGLRSGDWAMPEEINRVATDRLSDYLFAPSPDAVANLRQEGYRPDQIHLTGNVMADTVLANLGRARTRPVLGQLSLHRGQFGLVTLHRPSNVDDSGVLGALLSALGDIARDLPLVFPVHPRTRQRLGSRPVPGLMLTDPLGYLDFLALQDGAALVLTDSGGVQEETTVLGVPCLTLRESTERPVTVSEGTNRVVGRDPIRIAAAARDVLANPPAPHRPALWDGRAGERIAEILLAGGGPADRLRPTSRAAGVTAHALAGSPA